MKPYLGQMVSYRQRPGQVRAGQVDLAAMIVKINPRRVFNEGMHNEIVHEDSVDLVIFLPDSEPIRQQRVMEMTDKTQWHRWFVPAGAQPVSADGLAARLIAAEANIRKLSDQVIELAEMVTAPDSAPKRAKRRADEAA